MRRSHPADPAVQPAAGDLWLAGRCGPVWGVHGMTVVTRNVKEFELAGVQVLNPFAE
jgi:hypothetical protein